MKHDLVRIAWAAGVVVTGGLVMRDPPPTWAVWLVLFAVTLTGWTKARDRARRHTDEDSRNP